MQKIYCRYIKKYYFIVQFVDVLDQFTKFLLDHLCYIISFILYHPIINQNYCNLDIIISYLEEMDTICGHFNIIIFSNVMPIIKHLYIYYLYH
jgi:hypothetical protein